MMEDDELFVEMDGGYKQNLNIELRYNREKRLENAPSNVKILHSPDYVKKQSFFSSIMNNKGHKFIFIAIVILTILNLALYFYYNSFSSGKIDGIEIELDSFQYNGEILLNLVLSESKTKNEVEKEVRAFVRAFDARGEEIQESESVALYIGAKLILHFKMQEKGIKKIEATVMVGNKSIILSKRV